MQGIPRWGSRGIGISESLPTFEEIEAQRRIDLAKLVDWAKRSLPLPPKIDALEAWLEVDSWDWRDTAIVIGWVQWVCRTRRVSLILDDRRWVVEVHQNLSRSVVYCSLHGQYNPFSDKSQAIGILETMRAWWLDAKGLHSFVAPLRMTPVEVWK